MHRLSEIRRVCHAFVNFGRVGLAAWTGTGFPIQAFLRNGHVARLESAREAWLYSYVGTTKLAAIISSPLLERQDSTFEFWVSDYQGVNRRIFLKGLAEQGDISLFFEDTYSFLKVSGFDVVDVGANIGDSAVYFCCKGAKKVVGIEPDPAFFKLATENVLLNKLQNLVTINFATVAGESGRPGTDDTKANMVSPGEGISIPHFAAPIVTLGEVVAANAVSDAVLKLDCEGAEYEILQETPTEVLRHFSRILVEYHYGARELVQHLNAAGFHVEFKPPTRVPRPDLGIEAMYVGYLFASRIP